MLPLHNESNDSMKHRWLDNFTRPDQGQVHIKLHLPLTKSFGNNVGKTESLIYENYIYRPIYIFESQFLSVSGKENLMHNLCYENKIKLKSVIKN